MDRRNFFKFSAVSALGATAVEAKALPDKQIASIIDIDLCDGCANETMPLCVKACKIKNEPIFPVPKEPMMDYWPQTKHEDYSKQKDNISRLTPYNFTYIEKLEVDGKMLHIPRRCMHCDHPPCPH